jgi:type VI secretion system protein ImpA
VAAKAGADAAAKTAAAAAAAAAAATDAAPKFEALLIPLRQMDSELRARVAARQPVSETEGAAGPGSGPSAAGTTPAVLSIGGAINSRQDAIRALDAVAEFFRTSEPSSPVPLFLERAKRLVSKDFLEVLADIAPDGIPQARSAGGLPPSNG